jgi:hypothetical protein
LDRNEWLEFGIREGFCSAPLCSTHDGIPSTDAEDEEWGEGGDPCIHVIRPYTDDAEKVAVEENCAPAQWRKAEWLIENGADDENK